MSQLMLALSEGDQGAMLWIKFWDVYDINFITRFLQFLFVKNCSWCRVYIGTHVDSQALHQPL